MGEFTSQPVYYKGEGIVNTGNSGKGIRVAEKLAQNPPPGSL
jgi:hypothetical protein